jgi:hypothetical protein
MRPLRLTDAELEIVLTAARPIAVHLRDEFLRAVAVKLDGNIEVGPGTLHRIVVEVPRRFRDVPDLTGT